MRRIIGVLLVLGALGALLEGLGARWLARRALERAAAHAGVTLAFDGPEGGAFRGFRFRRLRFGGDGLEGTADEIEVRLSVTRLSRVRVLRPRLTLSARKRGQDPFSPRKRVLTPFPALEIRDGSVRGPDFEIEGLDLDGGRARAARAALLLDGRRLEAAALRAGLRWDGLTLFLADVTWEGAPRGRGTLALHLRTSALEVVADLPLVEGDARLTLDSGATVRARGVPLPGPLAAFLPPALASVRGRLDGEARFPDGPLDLTIRDAVHGDLALGTVRVRGTVAGSRLRIDEGRATPAGGRLSAGGTLDLATGEGDLRFEADLADAAVLPPLAGWLRGPVRATGALDGAVLTFTVRGDRVVPAPGLEARLLARGTLEAGRVQLLEASLTRGNSRLAAHGTVAASGPRAATLELEADGLLEELQPLLPRRLANARGSLAGQARLTLDAAGARLEGSARAAGVHAGPLAAGTGRATIALAGGRWRLGDLEAQADVGETRLSVRGGAARDSDGTWTASFTHATAALGERLTASLRDARLQCTPSGEATLTAPEGTALGGTLRSPRLSWSPATGGRAELALEGADPTPAFERAGWTGLRARSAGARGIVQYEEGRWSARGDLDLRSPVVLGEPFDSFAGRFLATRTRLELDAGELTGPLARVTGSCAFQHGTGVVQAEATAEAPRLAARLGLPGAWSGRVNARLHGEGPLEALRWSGFVHWPDGGWAPPRGPAWRNVSAAAVVGGDALGLEAAGECAGGRARASAQVRLDDAGLSRPWDRALWRLVTARVEGEGFALESLDPGARGTASFRLSAQGAPGGPFERSLEGTLEVRGGGWRDVEDAGLRAEVARGRVRAAASGRFLDGPWTAEAQVDLEPTGAPFGWELARSGTARATLADAALARIAGLPPGATGRIGAEAELTGFRPLTGTLRARAPDARVPVPGLDAPAENLSLTATLRGDDRVRLAGEAWIGHGRVGLEGLASRREARVRAAVEKVLVRDRAGLLARASGTLFFIGDRDGGLVTGTVFPDPLEVTARFDPTELPAPREHGPATPGRRLERVNLDVRIAGGRVLVENPDVTARFRPDLRVAGTAAAPRIEGSVRVEPGGELRLPTARLELREATLTFEDGDPARPMLAAVATTRLGDTELFVRAHGRAAEPDLDVHSLPPLPREDVIALLATGFTRAELAASRGGRDEDVRSLRALLDEPRQRELASRTGLGGVLERLEAQRVRPLDVGTRPGDTPGAPPTATGESPGRLIYRLTETLGLSAERDAYGDLNFNLLLRFRFP